MKIACLLFLVFVAVASASAHPPQALMAPRKKPTPLLREIAGLSQIREELMIQRKLLRSRHDVTRADFRLNRRMIKMIDRKLKSARQRAAEHKVQ